MRLWNQQGCGNGTGGSGVSPSVQSVPCSKPRASVSRLGFACNDLPSGCSATAIPLPSSGHCTPYLEGERPVDFWAETIDLQGATQAALTLTIHSRILFKGDLAQFYENHPYRQDPNNLLIGLKVRDIERNSFAKVTGIVGTIEEHREKLLEEATGAISKQALKDAPNEQPVVAVQFGKDAKPFHYAMAALRPCITPETAKQFEVDYGELLKATKVSYQDRKDLLVLYKQEAGQALSSYGFQLERSINSRADPELFWKPQVKLEQTKLLFGKNFTGIQSQILTGLSMRIQQVLQLFNSFDRASNYLRSHSPLSQDRCDRPTVSSYTEKKHKRSINP